MALDREGGSGNEARRSPSPGHLAAKRIGTDRENEVRRAPMWRSDVACLIVEHLIVEELQMTIPVHELEAEVLSLAAADRARILERLIESFERDTKIGEAWIDTALRREEEVISGQVKMVPGREAVARIRALLA